ncbi:hypothetical protein CK203_047132 [Vitis vinifera]|uniref:DUF4283 domain-containing protein n=1 Tax=Vitis vinifera TaxID=29760 RepID=A0A438GSU2_VITVI|nr:hypothetical protein CK203_047132 [Vitis vinifera]
MSGVGAIYDTQTERGMQEDKWEESDLAKFSQFLGFPTEGLEKEILNFLRLKFKLCRDNIARSIGSGRFLEWKAVNAEGASGGILICWDKRSLEILDWEEGQFTLSCRFRNVENGAIWMFTGVYGLFSKEEREALWDELGAIRGLWEDPCMRKFAEIVDDLGLMDLPLQGENLPGMRDKTIRPGQDWTGSLFPLVGQTSTMGLVNVEGFKDLVHSWWQGIEVRGSGSYKLATKIKEIKQKLKVWNRSLALQQVEFWDREESGRILTVEETELKKEAKDNYRKWGDYGRNSLETAF